MTPEQIEAAGYEAYREFIQYGVGTCVEITVDGHRVPETPEQACIRRWRRLSIAVRDQFLAEGKAELQAHEDMP